MLWLFQLWPAVFSAVRLLLRHAVCTGSTFNASCLGNRGLHTRGVMNLKVALVTFFTEWWWTIDVSTFFQTLYVALKVIHPDVYWKGRNLTVRCWLYILHVKDVVRLLHCRVLPIQLDRWEGGWVSRFTKTNSEIWVRNVLKLRQDFRKLNSDSLSHLQRI